MAGLLDDDIACGNYDSSLSFTHREYGFWFSSEKTAWTEDFLSILPIADVLWGRTNPILFASAKSKIGQHVCRVCVTIALWGMVPPNHVDYLSWIFGWTN